MTESGKWCRILGSILRLNHYASATPRPAGSRARSECFKLSLHRHQNGLQRHSSDDLSLPLTYRVSEAVFIKSSANFSRHQPRDKNAILPGESAICLRMTRANRLLSILLNLHGLLASSSCSRSAPWAPCRLLTELEESVKRIFICLLADHLLDICERSGNSVAEYFRGLFIQQS